MGAVAGDRRPKRTSPLAPLEAAARLRPHRRPQRPRTALEPPVSTRPPMRRRTAGQAVGRTPGQTLALDRLGGQEFACDIGRGAGRSGPRPGTGAARPWRRRGPVARRVAAHGSARRRRDRPGPPVAGGATGVAPRDAPDRRPHRHRASEAAPAAAAAPRPPRLQPSGSPSGPSRPVPRRRAPGPPRAAPSPGTSGRPGRRSRGSRPPGGRARAVRVATPRSIDGDGRGSTHDRRGRPRMR